MGRYAAVDLGASSGRVMVADVSGGAVELREVHRFPNRPVRVRGTLHWDLLALWAGTLDGLRLAGAGGGLDGVGVDSWAIDYALLDDDGQLLGQPVHYRDARTDGVAERSAALLPADQLYECTGVQLLPFNTVFQFVAARDTWAMRHARTALLIPDLLGYWLTGETVTELTNASTTGLVDTRTGQWAPRVFDALGLRTELFAPITPPGTALGTLLSDVAAECAVGRVPVTTVASHDTASAVLGVPATTERFAYISCGTWSLVGVEIDRPVIDDRARRANFSNELGIDGTVRFLRNVMGLWLLQECIREWERVGLRIELTRLLADAARLPGGRSVVDPDRPEFLPPGDMPARLRAECRRTGQAQPQTPAELTRCVLDSLAAAYVRTIREAEQLTGGPVEVVHIVGGGARNELLCQLTADACGLPVLAGPVEAAAYGNVLVQARAAGEIDGDRTALRRAVAAAGDIRRYAPS